MRSALFLVFLAAFAFFLLGTWTHSLWDADEPRFAEASRDMLVRGDFLLPMLNGEPRLDKPPLVYWLQMAGYTVFGVGETGARFPAALGLALAVMLTVRLGTRIFSLGAGLWAGLVLATCLLAGISGRAATADGLLLGCVMVTIDAMHARLHGRWTIGTWLALWLGFAACGLAKGPPGQVAPVMAGIGVFLLTRRTGSGVRTAGRIAGLAIAIGLLLAWAIPVNARTDGGILDIALGHHVVARIGGDVPGQGGFAPWWLLFYVASIPVFLFPWTAWLPAAIQRWRSSEIGADDRAFLGWWIGGTFLLFTLVIGKRFHYVLPLYPALAILIGGVLTARAPRPGKFGSVLVVVIGAVLGFGLIYYYQATGAWGGQAEAILLSHLFLLGSVLLASRPRSMAGMMIAAWLVLLFGLLPALDERRITARAGEALAATGATRRAVMDFRPDGLSFYSQRDADGDLTTDSTVPIERVWLGKPAIAMLTSSEPCAIVLTEERLKEVLTNQGLLTLPGKQLWRGHGFYAKKGKRVTVVIWGNDGEE